MENRFWEAKKLEQMTQDEWECLCDRCGLCCFRKILEGHLWWKKILKTRIACDLLDCSTCQCSDYDNRFSRQKECIKLDRKKLKSFKWLPQTCAYRLLMEGKPLPPWHPLVTDDPLSIQHAGIKIENPVHEKDVDDWYDYVTE